MRFRVQQIVSAFLAGIGMAAMIVALSTLSVTALADENLTIADCKNCAGLGDKGKKCENNLNATCDGGARLCDECTCTQTNPQGDVECQF